MKQMHTNFSDFIVFTSQMKFNLVLTYSCPRMFFYTSLTTLQVFSVIRSCLFCCFSQKNTNILVVPADTEHQMSPAVRVELVGTSGEHMHYLSGHTNDYH